MSEAHEALRVRIEAALRERWPDARVSVRPPMEDRYGGHDAMVVATWGNVEVLASGEDEQTALGEVAEAVCLDVRERADYLEARRGALLDEIERLSRRAEMRSTAPTNDELASHARHDGWWLVAYRDGHCDVSHVTRPASRDWCVSRGANRWIALMDWHPCAWPVVEVRP